MYFVYPPTGKNHIISLNYSQSPFPVDFFYSMNTVQDSDTIFVIANNGSMTQELKTSSYDNTAILSHPDGQLGIQKFQAVLRKGEDRKSLCFMPFWGFLWRDYKDSVMRLNMKPGCWRGFLAMCRNVYNFFFSRKESWLPFKLGPSQRLLFSFLHWEPSNLEQCSPNLPHYPWWPNR